MTTDNTGPAPTVEAAAQQISGLLSVPTEDRQPTETQPEQVPAAEPTQAPAAPDPEDTPPDESEQAKPDIEEAPEPAPSQSRTLKVKVDGEEIEITEDEAAKGYSRQADYTAKTQALAAEKAKWEREARDVERAALEKWVASAAELEQMVAPQEPNWEKLATELAPDVFQYEFLNWQKQQQQRKEVASAREQVQQRQLALEQEAMTARLADERASLVREIPDYADPVKMEAMNKELMEFGKSRGFTPEQLQITDHRLYLLLHDAYQGQKTKAKAPEIKNKIAKALVTATPGSDTPAPKKSDLTLAKQRLRDSGRTEDAAAAIAHLI